VGEDESKKREKQKAIKGWLEEIRKKRPARGTRGTRRSADYIGFNSGSHCITATSSPSSGCDSDDSDDAPPRAPVKGIDDNDQVPYSLVARRRRRRGRRAVIIGDKSGTVCLACTASTAPTAPAAIPAARSINSFVRSGTY